VHLTFTLNSVYNGVLGELYRVDMCLLPFPDFMLVPWFDGPLGCGCGVHCLCVCLCVFVFVLFVFFHNKCLFTSFPSFDSGTMAWWAPGLWWWCGGFWLSCTCNTLRQQPLRCRTCLPHARPRGQTRWSASSSRRPSRSQRIPPNRRAQSCNPRRHIGWVEVLLDLAQLCSALLWNLRQLWIPRQ